MALRQADSRHTLSRGRATGRWRRDGPAGARRRQLGRRPGTLCGSYGTTAHPVARRSSEAPDAMQHPPRAPQSPRRMPPAFAVQYRRRLSIMQLVTALIRGEDLHQHRSSACVIICKHVLSTGWPEGYSAPSTQRGHESPDTHHSEQASIAISMSNWQVSWTHTAQPCKCCALTNDLCSRAAVG